MGLPAGLLLAFLISTDVAQAAVTQRFIGGPLSRYPLSTSSFVDVGWTGDKSNCTHVAASFVPEETHGCRDEVELTYCNETPDALPRRLRTGQYAVCVPPLYGEVNPAPLNDWLRWHTSIGISTFFLYAIDAEPPPGLHADGARVLWLRVDWMVHKRAWQRGQLWAAHDCLYRARYSGLSWTLFMDVDEFLHTPIILPDMAQRLASANSSVATYGKKEYSDYGCAGADPGTWLDRAPSNLAPFCSASDDIEFCEGWKGLRKYFIDVQQVGKLWIHSIATDAVNEPAALMTTYSANDAWLMHCKGITARETGRRPRKCGVGQQRFSERLGDWMMSLLGQRPDTE